MRSSFRERLEDTGTNTAKGRRVIDWLQVTGSYQQRFSPFSPVDVCSGRFPSTTFFLLACLLACFFAVAKNWAHSIAVDSDSSSVKRRVTRMGAEQNVKTRPNFARHPEHNACEKPSFYSRHQRWHFCRRRRREPTRKSKSRIPDRTIPAQDTDIPPLRWYLFSLHFFIIRKT